jgi:hypothetical protein
MCLYRIKASIVGVIFLVACPLAICQTPPISFSTGESWFVSIFSPTDQDIVGTNLSQSWSLVLSTLTSQIPPNTDLDALDFKSENAVYFSLDCDARLGGSLYCDEDIIFWNGSGFSMVWDGSENGLPASANLDALHVFSDPPLYFIFSLDGSADLGGAGIVDDEDLVTFLQGLGSLNIAFDGSAQGIPSRADLDAVTVRNESQWLLSFDSPIRIGSVVFDDADLVSWNPGTSEFAPAPWFDASEYSVPDRIDIDAARVFLPQPLGFMYY